MSGLTAEELARQAGTTSEQIERFIELGILERGEGSATFGPRDIHRVRFAEAIDAAGISLDDLARLVEAGEYAFVIETNWGLPAPELGQRPCEDDARALRERAAVRDLAQLDAEGLAASSRFVGENIRRLAVSQLSFLREHVMAAMLARGVRRKDGSCSISPTRRRRLRAAFTWSLSRRRKACLRRAGLHAGGVVSRDGDYFGQTVNLASRIADYARPREVLVSADVAELAKEAALYEPIGDITLRGVIDPVSLLRGQIRDTLPAG